MGTHAFIAYSTPQSDAHMVYELGGLDGAAGLHRGVQL
jgi:hypothetical protein